MTLKKYVWVYKFPITAHTKKEAIEQIKMDFDFESVIIHGRDISIDLEYLGIEKVRDYDKKMYEYMENEYSDNPEDLNFPRLSDKERKEERKTYATELN